MTLTEWPDGATDVWICDSDEWEYEFTAGTPLGPA